MTIIEKINAVAARHQAELEMLRSLAVRHEMADRDFGKHQFDDDFLRWPFARSERVDTRTRFEKQQERQTIRILGEVESENRNPNLSSSIVQYRFAFLAPDGLGGWEVDDESLQFNGPDVIAVNLSNPETAITTFPFDTTGWIRSNNPVAELLVWEFEYRATVEMILESWSGKGLNSTGSQLAEIPTLIAETEILPAGKYIVGYEFYTTLTLGIGVTESQLFYRVRAGTNTYPFNTVPPGGYQLDRLTREGNNFHRFTNLVTHTGGRIRVDLWAIPGLPNDTIVELENGNDSAGYLWAMQQS